MSGEDEYPTNHGTKSNPKKPTFRELVADLGNRPVLDSTLKLIGIPAFDPSSARHFADNGFLTLPEATMDQIRAEAKGQCTDQNSAQRDFQCSPSSSPTIAALAHLAGVVFRYAKRTSLQEPDTRPSRCKVSLCTEEAEHLNDNSPVRLFLALGRPIGVWFYTRDKSVSMCKIGTPVFPASESSLLLTHTTKRGGWGTCFKAYQPPWVPAVDPPAKLWYLMFTEDVGADPAPIVAKRSFAQIDQAYRSAMDAKLSALNTAFGVSTQRGPASMSFISLAVETGIARTLFFDDSSVWEKDAVAATAQDWIRGHSVKQLFAIEGSSPLSLDGDKSQILACCQKFVDATRHTSMYWHDVKFFDEPVNMKAAHDALEEVGALPDIAAACEVESKGSMGHAKKHELLINCLYLVAVCKFVARSCPRKPSAMDYNAICAKLWDANDILSKRLDANAFKFFEHLMTPRTKQSKPPAAKKNVDSKPQPKKQPAKRVTRKPKFVEEAADDDDEEEDDGEEEDDDEYEKDSFVVGSSEDEADGEVDEEPKNPYFEPSEDDGSHVSGTDEEDMGVKTPVARKRVSKPPPVKKPSRGKKRELAIEDEKEEATEEPKTQKKGRLTTESSKKGEDRTNLLTQRPGPPVASDGMLELTGTAAPIQSPLVPTAKSAPVLGHHEFPFDDLDKLRAAEYLKITKDWSPAAYEDVFRDKRVVEYQTKHLGEKIRAMITNANKPFDTILSQVDLQRLDCWVVRFKLPVEAMYNSQLVTSKAATKRLIDFETKALLFDHAVSRPGDHLIGSMVKNTVGDGKPAYCLAFTYIQNKWYTRVSRLAIFKSADSEQSIKPLGIPSKVANGIVAIDSCDPNADGFMLFSNLYVLWARKGEDMNPKLQEAFAGLYTSIEQFDF